MATTYQVLRRVTNDLADLEGWVEVGKVDATNDKAAIRAIAAGGEGVEGGVDLSNGAVAVPVRNWRPRKPERKVTESTLWS